MTSGVQTSGCERCGEISLASAQFCPACGAPRLHEFTGDALIGELVGERFLIKERMGHGASGTIYVAEHVTLRRRVALKVLHHELSRDDLAIERFRREATTVSEIDNEHIVHIHDFGRTADGRLYLAMEYLEGETLDTVLKRDKRLPVERTVDILIQLGEALMEAHAIGYIHRDLRPRNVFLSVRRGSANFVKLLDFGLAKLVEREGEAATTSLGMTFGDPKYMSPEQARGEGLDRRADIYSLGCIAYEMLIGEPPFTGGRVFDILSRHVDAEPMVPSMRRPDVPAWLDATVLRMLAKSPEERFVTVYRLVEALRQGLATGATMSGETARRRATNPPASISRTMQQFGFDEEVDEAAAPMPVPVENDTARVDQPPETLEGSPLGGGASDSADDLRATQVRHRGSGPVSGAAVPSRASQSASQSASATASGKQRVASSDTSQTGISAAWFADGESRLGEGTDENLDDDQREKLSRARARSHEDFTDEFYAQGPSPLKKFAVPAAAVVVVLLGAIIFWPSGSKKTVAVSPGDAGVLTAVVTADAGVAIEADGAVADTADAGAIDARARTTQVDRPPTPPKDPDPPDPIDNKPSDDQAARQAEFYARLADQALRSGDTLGAAGNYKKALELNSKNVDAVAGMGEIALMQSLHADAIAHLKKAVALAPKRSRIHTLLGDAYLGSGKDELAAASFKKALQLNPDDARARNGYNEAIGRIPPPGDDPF